MGLVGAGAVFSGAFLNPFTVGVAQGIAGLPLFSGVGYRLLVWSVITAITAVLPVPAGPIPLSRALLEVAKVRTISRGPSVRS